MIKGLVLLVAVGIDVYSKRQGRPSILGPLRPQPRRRRHRPAPASPTGETSPQANNPAAADDPLTQLPPITTNR